MFKINDNYLKLPGSYLFSTIAKKVAAYKEANPERPDHQPWYRRCDTAIGPGCYCKTAQRS